MQRYIIVTDKTNIIRSNSKLVESFTFTRFCFSLARLFVTLTCRSKVLSLGSKNITYFILYFSRLFVPLSSSRADCTLYGCGWAGGQDIYKGVYYALVLTVRNPEKISCKSGTKQRECPVGMLYACLTLLYSHWCIL